MLILKGKELENILSPAELAEAIETALEVYEGEDFNYGYSKAKRRISGRKTSRGE